MVYSVVEQFARVRFRLPKALTIFSACSTGMAPVVLAAGINLNVVTPAQAMSACENFNRAVTTQRRGSGGALVSNQDISLGDFIFAPGDTLVISVQTQDQGGGDIRIDQVLIGNEGFLGSPRNLIAGVVEVIQIINQASSNSQGNLEIEITNNVVGASVALSIVCNPANNDDDDDNDNEDEDDNEDNNTGLNPNAARGQITGTLSITNPETNGDVFNAFNVNLSEALFAEARRRAEEAFEEERGQRRANRERRREEERLEDAQPEQNNAAVIEDPQPIDNGNGDPASSNQGPDVAADVVDGTAIGQGFFCGPLQRLRDNLEEDIAQLFARAFPINRSIDLREERDAAQAERELKETLLSFRSSNTNFDDFIAEAEREASTPENAQFIRDVADQIEDQPGFQQSIEREVEDLERNVKDTRVRLEQEVNALQQELITISDAQDSAEQGVQEQLPSGNSDFTSESSPVIAAGEQIQQEIDRLQNNINELPDSNEIRSQAENNAKFRAYFNTIQIIQGADPQEGTSRFFLSQELAELDEQIKELQDRIAEIDAALENCLDQVSNIQTRLGTHFASNTTSAQTPASVAQHSENYDQAVPMHDYALAYSGVAPSYSGAAVAISDNLLSAHFDLGQWRRQQKLGYQTDGTLPLAAEDHSIKLPGLLGDERFNLFTNATVTFGENRNFDQQSVGYAFSGGMSWLAHPLLNVGLAGRFQRSNIDSAVSDIDANTWGIAAFAQSQLPFGDDVLNLEGIIAYSHSDLDSIFENLGIVTTANSTTDVFSSQVKASTRFNYDDISINPFISLSYIDINQDAFTLSDGQFASGVGKQDVIFSSGISLATSFFLPNTDIKLNPSLSLGASGVLTDGGNIGFSATGGLGFEAKHGINGNLGLGFSSFTSGAQNISINARITIPLN